MSANTHNSVLDPRLLPPGAEAVQDAGHAQFSQQQQTNSPTQANVAYQSNQPYYNQRPSMSSGSNINAGQSLVQNEEDYSPEDANNSPSAEDAKRQRACEACRGLKVRCDQDPAQPDQPCKRCAKAGRQCIVTQPTRKRQKKADGRVADLERKLDALTAALRAQQNGSSVQLDGLEQQQTYPTQSPVDNGKRSFSAAQDRRTSYPLPVAGGSAYPLPQSTSATNTAYPALTTPPEASSKKRKLDHVTVYQANGPMSNDYNVREFPAKGRTPDNQNPNQNTEERSNHNQCKFGAGPEPYHLPPAAFKARICSMVDPVLHDKIFDRYLHEFMPNFPAVYFPPETRAHDVMEKTPALFLSVVAVACTGLVPQQIQFDLFDELITVMADAMVRNSAKSLELIQMMLVTILWFKPHNRPHQANFYMTLHMAATMALDLGLGRRFNPNKVHKGFGGAGQANFFLKLHGAVNSDAVESRRTWLSCYYLCASAAQSLRRPNLIRWSDYMQECVDFLETSPDAAPTDKRLTQFVRLQVICDDISDSFRMNDSSATSISISDPKVSYTLDVYEQKLKDARERIPAEERDNPLLIYFYDVASLYLHEIALHVNHNIDDFRLPFTEEGLRSGSNHSEVMTQRQMAALESCLQSAHRIIDTWCGLGLELISTLPTLFYFVRCIYAIVVLIKMHLAVTTPGSEVGKIIKPEDVRVEDCMNRLHDIFREMNKKEVLRPNPKMMMILNLLREWFQTHKAGDAQQKENKEPFGRHLASNVGDSRLQVLSEAATAGSSSSNSNAASATQWTYDSPTVLPYPQSTKQHPNNATNSTSSTGPSPDTYGSSVTTPTFKPYSGIPSATNDKSQQSQNNTSYANNNNDGSGSFDSSFFDPSLMYDGMATDWTAGMGLEQVLDGAFRDFDISGDLGGWFMGDGVSAYQIPDQAAGLSNDGGGGANRW